jgi:hypothetical protein
MKMKAQHTPGPWDIGQYAVNDYAHEIYATGVKVAVVEGWLGDAKAVSDANMALIAAAPDLLEACKAVLDMKIEIDMEDALAFEYALDKVTAAISKAEGGKD